MLRNLIDNQVTTIHSKGILQNDQSAIGTASVLPNSLSIGIGGTGSSEDIAPNTVEHEAGHVRRAGRVIEARATHAMRCSSH